MRHRSALRPMPQPEVVEVDARHLHAVEAERVHVRMPEPRPVDELDAEFEARLRGADEFGLVDAERAVEFEDGRDRGLADADGADLLGLDELDGERRRRPALSRTTPRPSSPRCRHRRSRFSDLGLHSPSRHALRARRADLVLNKLDVARHRRGEALDVRAQRLHLLGRHGLERERRSAIRAQRGMSPAPSSSQAQSVSSNDSWSRRSMRPFAPNRSSLCASDVGQRSAARVASQKLAGSRAARAVVRDGEIAHRIGMFGHDAVVFDGFDGAAAHRVETARSSVAMPSLREMQVGAGERFELHGRGAERDAVARPRIGAAGRCETAPRSRASRAPGAAP